METRATYPRPCCKRRAAGERGRRGYDRVVGHAVELDRLELAAVGGDAEHPGALETREDALLLILRRLKGHIPGNP